MAHVIPDQNAGHKLGGPLGANRKLIVLGVGAAAALALLLARRSSAAAAAPAATAATTDPSQTPSTFADNGGQAAAAASGVSDALASFGTQVSGQFDQVNQSLAQLATNQQTLSTNQGDLAQRVAQAAPIDPATPVVVNVAAPAAAAAPAPSGSPAGAPKPTFKSIIERKPGSSVAYVHHVYTDPAGKVTRDVAVGQPIKTTGSPAGKTNKRK